ncbi:IclR family transcriptional regulator [Actinotalea sp.]|uniref:IclR family transcriptional regulator n=1 Tax=Actinotalea sp. TaxID=1872145 RepID=UPI00356A44E4
MQRILTVLDFVSLRAQDGAPGVVEIARGVGLEKSVVSRLLRTLVETGLLVRDPGLGYRIGPRLYSVAAAAQDARLVELGTRAIAVLADTFGERSELYTRTGNLAMCVATASPDSPLQVTGWVGRTYPLVGTAAGRALLLDLHEPDLRRLVDAVGIGVSGPLAPRTTEAVLARLDEDRERGISLSVEEVDRGLLALGAPVRNATGQIIASVVVSGPSDRITSCLPDLLIELPVRAAEVSAGLRHTEVSRTPRPASHSEAEHHSPQEVTP